jgi:hypothetical protein
VLTTVNAAGTNGLGPDSTKASTRRAVRCFKQPTEYRYLLISETNEKTKFHLGHADVRDVDLGDEEELDGLAVSVLSVRPRKLSNIFEGQSNQMMGGQILLSRAPPCFGRLVKPLIQVAFAVVSIHSSFKEGRRQAGGQMQKIIAESLSQHNGPQLVIR